MCKIDDLIADDNPLFHTRKMILRKSNIKDTILYYVYLKQIHFFKN